MVSFAVRDTGCGIAPDRLNAIFEPFVLLDRTLKNPHQGTGLGLAISRDLALQMNWSVSTYGRKRLTRRDARCILKATKTR
jgi:signal transduction histidine kinase